MKIKLKPCPFCGGEAKVFKYRKAMASFGTMFSYEGECAYCFVRTGRYPSEEKAVNAWNRREGERKLPEVIRCSECKWWTKQKNSGQGRCELLGIYPTGGWYCANGATETK